MATNKLELTRYLVSRWTAFAWSSEMAGGESETFLQRAAGLIERELRVLCPKYEPDVAQVRVEGGPQLRLRLTLPADSAEDALARLDYYVSRAMSARAARVPTGWRREVTLRPPWGREEARRLGQ